MKFLKILAIFLIVTMNYSYSTAQSKRVTQRNQSKKATIVVKITGVRHAGHNGDCKRIHGSMALNLKPDLNCNDFLRPKSGSRFCSYLQDRNSAWQRNWTPKRMATWALRNPNQKSPNNMDQTAVYNIDEHYLKTNGFGLSVVGFFQGCHKQNDFAGDYHCSVMYPVNHNISLRELKKNKTIKKTIKILGSRSTEHKLVFYIEVSRI